MSDDGVNSTGNGKTLPGIVVRVEDLVERLYGDHNGDIHVMSSRITSLEKTQNRWGGALFLAYILLGGSSLVLSLLHWRATR